MRIVVVPGGIKAMAAELGKNRNTIAAALAGTTRSPLAKRIRELAVEKYGGMAVTYKTPKSV